MLETIAIDGEDFKKIIDNNYFYIDKTLFIKHIIDDGNYATIITRPRKFGKSLNLSMLKYYFDINLDSKDLFNCLNIMSCDEKYILEMNSCPVIFLSLKDLNCDSYEDNITSFKTLISKIYKEHSYLLNSDKLSDAEKENINKVINNVEIEVF